MLIALLLLACRCNEAPVPAPAPHFSAFGDVVHAASQGELVDARRIARDLPEEPDASAVAAALGFIQMAEDRAEVADGVAGAAVACGRCHMKTGVGSPAPPPRWSHRTAVDHVVYGLVWTAPLAPPLGGEDEAVQAMAAAWNAQVAVSDTGAVDEREVRAARVLVACAGCHPDKSE